jgi:uncharacterized protein with PQ loop repeat
MANSGVTWSPTVHVAAVHCVHAGAIDPRRSGAQAGKAMNPDIIGWAASAVLMATLVQQVVKQARDDSAQGVSKWLFAGQILASIGFIVYSALVGSVIFVVTNSCILVTAIVGQIITARKQRAGGRRDRR